MQLKWHWITTEHNHLQSLSCPQVLRPYWPQQLQGFSSPCQGAQGFYCSVANITSSALYPALTRGRSAALLPALEVYSTGTVQPQSLHHSRSAVSSFTLTMPSVQTTLRCAGKTRDARQRFKHSGPFSGYLLGQRSWAFPSTLHPTMKQVDRTHLQQEALWNFWC